MCHLLIIEDNPLIAGDFAEIASEAGATSIHIAASPAEAMQCALSTSPAVLFSDVQIVDGTGPKVVTAIRNLPGSIPVIFITATPELCRDFAENTVLLKPVVRGAGNRGVSSCRPQMKHNRNCFNSITLARWIFVVLLDRKSQL